MSKWQDFGEAWATLFALGVTYGTRLLAAFFILVVGYLIARLLDKVVRILVRKSGLESLLERLDLSKLLYRVGIHAGFAQVLGRVSRYLVIAVSLFVAVDVAGIVAFSNFRDQFFAFVPRGLTGLALLIMGLFLAEWARAFTVATIETSDLVDSPELIGKGVQFVVIVLAFATAGEHLGLEIQLIRQSLLVVFGTAGFAFAIGLGFGGQRVIRNLLSRAYVEQALPVGSRVVIDEVELGVLKAFAAQSVVFEDEEGRETWVPYVDFVTHQFRVLGIGIPSVDP